MASIRCPNCNLLNFDTAPECKRCRQPFGSAAPETAPLEAAPEAAYAGFGTNGVYQTTATVATAEQAPQAPARPTSSYYEPPPPNFYNDIRGDHPAPAVNNYTRTITVTIPPVCVKCGSSHNLSMQKFKKDYTPPAAYLGVFLGGLLPLVIMVLIFRKRHKMNGLFCPQCWNIFKKYNLISNLAALAFFVFLFGGIIMAIASNRGGVALFGFVLALAIGIWASYYTKKISPKFVKTNRKQIYIRIPNFGEVDFTNSGL